MPLVSPLPLLLIDVDGVLNPYVRPRTTLGAQYATHRIGEQVVRLTTSHGEWLHRLAELYDLVWATTWEADANAFVGPIIGAPPNLPVISFTDRDDKDWTWKLPAVERFVADRPLAWLDDDPGQGADEWRPFVRSRLSSSSRMDTTAGLRRSTTLSLTLRMGSIHGDLHLHDPDAVRALSHRLRPLRRRASVCAG